MEQSEFEFLDLSAHKTRLEKIVVELRRKNEELKLELNDYKKALQLMWYEAFQEMNIESVEYFIQQAKAQLKEK